MKFEKYKRYYLVLIPFILLCSYLLEEKNDICHTIAVVGVIFGFYFGNWLSIQESKRLNIPINFMLTFNFWISWIIGIPMLIIMLLRLKL
jgi:hypothetical protein